MDIGASRKMKDLPNASFVSAIRSGRNDSLKPFTSGAHDARSCLKGFGYFCSYAHVEGLQTITSFRQRSQSRTEQERRRKNGSAIITERRKLSHVPTLADR